MEEKKEKYKPPGNPNIGEISKKKATGPRTVMGKLSGAIKTGVLQHGNNSKIIQRLRASCKVCPLRARIEERIIGGELKRISIPAKCPHYQPQRKKCVIPVEHYVQKMRTFIKLMDKNEEEVQKVLISQAVEDAQCSREVEMMLKGHPGFYTKEFQEQAMKYNSELIKAKHPVQNVHLHEGEDVISRIIKNVRNKKKDIIEGEVVKDGDEEMQQVLEDN